MNAIGRLFVGASFLACTLVWGCGSEEGDSAGCAQDSDCKGDRVCDEGTCVAPDGPAGAGGGVAGAGAGGGDVVEPGGPQYLSFGTNVSELSGISGEASVTFTAVLTDPDGVDDLIGGSLIDESGAPYGAFTTSGQEGAYEMTVSWSQINSIASIDFATGPGLQREFTAEFFDAAGHKSQKTIGIQLSCEGSSACEGECGLGSCGAECVYLVSDENCGQCGNDCGYGYCDTKVLVCMGDESTDALCSDGIDNDGDSYLDCDDYNCSMNAQVTVCN